MAAKPSDTELTCYRWEVTGRVLVAAFGGYALASLVGILLSVALPLSRADAVVTANTLSFAFYTGAIVWVFSASNLRRAWVGLLLPGLAIGALLLLIALFGSH